MEEKSIENILTELTEATLSGKILWVRGFYSEYRERYDYHCAIGSFVFRIDDFIIMIQRNHEICCETLLKYDFLPASIDAAWALTAEQKERMKGRCIFFDKLMSAIKATATPKESETDILIEISTYIKP